MTNTQLAELLLVRLYDLAEAEGHFKLHGLNEIAAEFGVSDTAKVFRIAEALEGRGLIMGTFAHGPTVHAAITGEGSLFVERGGDTGVIREYREHPATFTVIDQSTHFHAAVQGSNVVVHSSNNSQSLESLPEIRSLLASLETAIRANADISGRLREEALGDVAILGSELAREQPRKPVVNSILATLGDISSITSLIMQLQALLPSLTWFGG